MPGKITPVQKFWIMAAEYYGIQLTESRLAMYCADCADYDLEQLNQAFFVYRNKSKERRIPLPVDLKRILQGDHLNDDGAAAEVSARVITALEKFGGCDFDRAKDYLGEVGCKVVQLQGGWKSLCMSDISEIPTRQAQMRQIAKSLLEKSRVSDVDLAPKFPKNQANVDKVLGDIGDKLKIVKRQR